VTTYDVTLDHNARHIKRGAIEDLILILLISYVKKYSDFCFVQKKKYGLGKKKHTITSLWPGELKNETQPTDHICLINLQLSMQSMQVLNPAHGEAYSIQHYVIVCYFFPKTLEIWSGEKYYIIFVT
jgi:hypothetical protein